MFENYSYTILSCNFHELLCSRSIILSFKCQYNFWPRAYIAEAVLHFGMLFLKIWLDNRQIKRYLARFQTNIPLQGRPYVRKRCILLIVSQLIDGGNFFRFKWKIHSKASKWHQPCFDAMSNIGVRWHTSQQKNTQFAVDHILWKLAWCENFDR